MSSKGLEPLICPQCGGQIDRATMTCKHCETQFKRQEEVIRIITERPGEHTLSASAAIPNHLIYTLGAEKASELALTEIAKKMAKCIMPFISVKTSAEDIWMEDTTLIRGRLRVCDPETWVR